MDWDKVRKNRSIAKRGTSADNEIVATFAPMWRRPFKASASKAELREQAKLAWTEWQIQQATYSSSLAALSNFSSA